MSVYVVDSNFFIQAHRAIYPLDVAVSFWEKIKDLAIDGIIISIDKVKREIYDNEDELKQWCIDNLPNDFFKSTVEVITSYQQIVNWTNSKSDHYLQSALNEFLDAGEADAWLVAYGLHHGCFVTTYEKSQPGRKNKIKIPEPCLELGVSFVDTIEMFRQLGVKF